MLKRFGLAAGAAVGMVLGGASGSQALAEGGTEETGQVGLANLNNVDVLHQFDFLFGFCDQNINVLIVQVPVQDSLNGVASGLGTPGGIEATGDVQDSCVTEGITNQGSSQGS